jgi:hypothetical protein
MGAGFRPDQVAAYLDRRAAEAGSQSNHSACASTCRRRWRSARTSARRLRSAAAVFWSGQSLGWVWLVLMKSCSRVHRACDRLSLTRTGGPQLRCWKTATRSPNTARAVSGPSPTSANRQSGWVFGGGTLTGGSTSGSAWTRSVEPVSDGVVAMRGLLSAVSNGLHQDARHLEPCLRFDIILTFH